MRIVPVVLLRHETRGGSHYDFMLPPRNEGPLAAWRVMRPTWQWAPGMRIDLWSLPPHRRAHLRREGEVSGGRGWVWRVDEGTVMVRLWAEGRIVIDVHTRHFRGAIALQRFSATRWAGSVEG